MNPFAKINVLCIIKGHCKTFGYETNQLAKIMDYILFIAIPVMVGLVYSILLRRGCLHRLPDEFWNVAITVTSIFTPLTLTLLMGLVALKEDLAPNPRAIKLLKSITYNICHLILVSLALLGVVVGILIMRGKNSAVASGLAMTIFSHLILTLLMVLKRFVALFLEATDK